MLDINVLLVDDDPDQLDLVASYLQSAHLVVEAASSGDEALALLAHYRPEVVVSDMSMPGMDGRELFRRVRELGHEDVAFLFRSALADVPQRVLGLRTGADDYIAKSGNLDELLLKVRLSIEKHRKTKLLRELAEAKRPAGILSGRLGEVPVAELLQIVAFLDLDGVCVSLQSATRASGTVYLDHGKVVHAEARSASGKKAFARLLRFTDGVFNVSRKAFTGKPTMNESLEKCLLDGLTRLDRTRELEARIRARGPAFRLEASADVLTRRFDEPTARFLALVTDAQTLDELLDECPAEDDEVLTALGELLDAGILTGRAESVSTEPATFLSLPEAEELPAEVL